MSSWSNMIFVLDIYNIRTKIVSSFQDKNGKLVVFREFILHFSNINRALWNHQGSKEDFEHQKFFQSNNHAFHLPLNMGISLDTHRSNHWFLSYCLLRHQLTDSLLYDQIHKPCWQMNHIHWQDLQAPWQVQDHIDMNNQHKCFSWLNNCNFFLLNCNSDRDMLNL